MMETPSSSYDGAAPLLPALPLTSNSALDMIQPTSTEKVGRTKEVSAVNSIADKDALQE